MLTSSQCDLRGNCVNNLGMWNVRGKNGIAMRKEVVDVFKEGKFELLILTETKFKGNGEVSWCEVNGIVEGIQEIERATEGAAILINDSSTVL